MSVEKKLKIVNKNKFILHLFLSGQALMIADSVTVLESNGFRFEPTKFTYYLEEMPKEKNIFHGFNDQFTFRVRDSLFVFIFGIAHIS